MRIFVNFLKYQFVGMSRRSSSSYQKFEDYIKLRRTQAEKSILIQVSSPNSASEVHSYLTSQFGPLNEIYHYSLPGKGKHVNYSSIPPDSGQFHWVLAEFGKQEDFNNALRSCRHAEGALAYKSSMCWFSQKNSGGEKSSASRNKQPISNITSPVKSERLGMMTDESNLGKSKSLNDQLKVLEKSVNLTDLGVRVRFLIASQLEQSVEKFFPSGCVLPFGSSVSGIGRQGGDLDLVLLHDKSEIIRSTRKGNEDSRLMYQSKLYTSGTTSNARFQVQRVMENVADIIQLFVPGCTHVQRILQARVPILRFWSDYTELQCDLSMTNSSGVHMSELIYIMSSLEHRFPTLLCAIRAWASARKITNPVPGRQPTNFMFVLLLIYFLQHKKMLPTLDVLFNNPDKDDVRTTADGIDCTFLRDPEKILKLFTPQCKTESASELLFKFFEFYSEFDFQNKGVSLITGSSRGKPDASSMYIQNPLERHLNVARNVSREEVSRLKSECCSALWKLETSHSEKQSVSIKQLLLTPQFEKSVDHRLKMKDILSD